MRRLAPPIAVVLASAALGVGAEASPFVRPQPVFNRVYLANGFPVQIVVGVSFNGGLTYINVPIKAKSGQDIVCGKSCFLAVSTHGSVATVTALGGHTYMLVFNDVRRRYEIRLPPV